MSIIDRVRTAATGNLRSAQRNLPSGIVNGLLSTSRSMLGRLTRPDAVQPKQAEQGARGPALPWTSAPLYGGLTLDKYRQLAVDSAMLARSWKNLWFLSIEEYQASRESPSGPGPINLLAVDASFTAFAMPGEQVQLGSANMDKLESTERVELRLTCFDDDRGSIKRWFIAKADQAAHVDGTFGLPAEYLCTITITHMATFSGASPSTNMTHRWLMRPNNVDLELSRRANELEEVPMSFVQFDTFMGR